MQHLYFQKNALTFDLTFRVESVSMIETCATMLLLASFPLIWYATWPYSEQDEFWPPLHRLSTPRVLDAGLRTKILFGMFHICCTSVCMQTFGKILTTHLVIVKFKYLTFDPWIKKSLIYLLLKNLWISRFLDNKTRAAISFTTA